MDILPIVLVGIRTAIKDHLKLVYRTDMFTCGFLRLQQLRGKFRLRCTSEKACKRHST
ncbi:hypothetical protein WN55_03142 [Dufourea novaeangliae]|uniref:Uncharacterized protein n=1 Tax=Dufourea novaeangliae TaxID=178035 RepID=A0A154PJJ5_DUFNO|nr:hypothetical protein WN55_03142 [Dufourea novaeangliae]